MNFPDEASHAKADKLRQMRLNQERWMRERQASQDVLSTISQAESTASSDNLLNTITEKITTRLRTELKGELRKSNNLLKPDKSLTLTNQLETFLSSELHTHTCQICFELMMPPHKSPTLLFPCGHTFCKFCVTRNAETTQGGKAKCPYCRERISSLAENHSLRQLIERFGEQREKLETGEVEKLDELPTTSAMSEEERNRKKYSAEFSSCQMRHKILTNELSTQRSTLPLLATRLTATRSAIKLLANEREEVERRKRMLDDELDLIEKTIGAQREKEQGVKNEEKEARKAIQVVEVTLESLEKQMEKARVLAVCCE